MALMRPALAAAFWAVAAAAAADPAGVYAVTGVNPDGGPYSGRVVVEPLGQTWRVRWTIGDDAFSGVGLRDGDRFAVGFHGDFEGVALFTQTADGGWDGTWASVAGGGMVGRETWRR